MTVKGWQTWDGRMVTMTEISHQHLSNIYYYTHFTMAEYYPQSVRDDIRMWLKIRFGGVILPYKPDPEFVYEKQRLSEIGALQTNGDILMHGEKVGEYSSANL